MKQIRLFASLFGAALACAALTALPASADFHCPEKLQGHVVSTPNSQDGQIYTDDALYAASTTHTALVVVVKPGAAFPNEILSSEQHKLLGDEHTIQIAPSPWTRWFPPIDSCLPIDKTAQQYEAGVFEQSFSAAPLSADREDPCGSVYRGALTRYALSDCWLLSPTMVEGHTYYSQYEKWRALVNDLKESPAVQGIYEVGYNYLEPATLTGGFEFKTTSQKAPAFTDFANVTVPGYPDFAVKSFAPVPIEGIDDYNDGWYHIDVTGIKTSDHAGYYKAWQALKPIVDEKADANGVKVFEISMNAAMQNVPIGLECIPFVDALYEAETPKTDGRFTDNIFEDVSVEKDIVYAEKKDYQQKDISLKLDLYQPEADDMVNRPVIIWAHGGGMTSGSKDSPSDPAMVLSNDFAKKGYVCISMDYRLDPTWEAQDTFMQTMKNAAEDVASVVEWVRENAEKYGMNPDCIALAGYSTGAEIVDNMYFSNFLVNEMAFDKKGIKAVVSLSGNRLLYDDVACSGDKNTKCLILHGDADGVNPYADAQTFLLQLGARGVMKTLAGNGHDWLQTDEQTTFVIENMVDFLKTNLLPAEPEFPVTPGDVNADGENNIADIVLFGKWLTAVPDTKLSSQKAADLNGDGVLNAFDLGLMKRELNASKYVSTIALSASRDWMEANSLQTISFHVTDLFLNTQQKECDFVQLRTPTSCLVKCMTTAQRKTAI